MQRGSCRDEGRRLHTPFGSDDFVSAIKFVPVLVEKVHVTIQRLELWVTSTQKGKILRTYRGMLVIDRGRPSEIAYQKQ